MTSKKTLKDLFYSLATKYYVDVDYPAELPIPILATFYFILSKYFKNISINFGAEEKDLRFSFFFIGESRVGKGQLIKVLETIAEKLGVSHCRQTKFNSASLIGTISEAAVVKNMTDRRQPGDEKYVEPRVFGDLFYFDVVIFCEAKKLLMENADKEELLEDLQEALDSPGRIRKKLKWDVILEYVTNASLYSTTYYAKEITENLLYKGFYQRQLLYMRELTPQEVISLRKKIIALYGKREGVKVEFDKEVDEFVERVKALDNSKRTMYLTPEAINFLNDVMDRYEKKLEESSGKELTILKSFSQTIIDITVKIGAIISLISGKKDIITEVDLNQALKFSKAALDTLLNKLVIKEDAKDYADKNNNKIFFVFKELEAKGTQVTRTSLVDECIKRGLPFGKNKLFKLINRMVSQQFFKEIKGDKNIRYLALNK